MTTVVEGELTRGKQIILRTKTLADADQDYAWRRDPELAAFDAARPYNGSLREYMSIFGDELSYPSPYRRTIGVADFDGRHIGNVMYYNIDDARGEAELGITIGDRRFWGTGYGRDAVRTFVRFLFQHVHMRRIYLNTLDWNVRAQRSFAAAGFVQYGASKRGMHSFISMEILREWLADELDRPAG